MNWERQKEAPVWEAFESNNRLGFSGNPVEIGGIKPEWSEFETSIAEAAAEHSGLRVVGASRVVTL